MEIKVNHKNWLGSAIGYVPKTTTILATETKFVTENGRKIVKSGTLITDPVLGKGLLVNDADITDGNVEKAIMIRGTYINANLPTPLDSSVVTELATQGLYSIEYGETEIAYGEVTR